MLGDQNAVVVGDEGVCCSIFGIVVIPGRGVSDLHGCGRADGSGTEVEGSITGDDFGIRISADISDDGFGFGDVAVFDHFVELHTGSDTDEVTSFIDGSEGVVVVGDVGGVGLGSGGMGEPDIGIFSGGSEHVIFVSEGIGEDDVAGSGKFGCCGIAVVIFGNAGDDLELAFGKSGCFDCCGHGIDEVFVVGRRRIVETDETDFEVAAGSAIGT